jgi:hypothetical protein
MKVRQWSALSLPLVPGPGIGVPLWSDRRDAIRTAVREQGVFLPVHWPEHGMFPLASNYLKWHQSEVTLPTYLHFSDRDERYMVDTIFTADSICIRT